MGPTLPISQEIHEMKYRAKGETFEQAMDRIARTLSDNDKHYNAFREILLDQRFLPAGRVQAAIGLERKVTPYNCFVSGTIDDSMYSIMERATQAAMTMKMGGGIGYDFSTIRPYGDLVVSQDTQASGPLSFMQIFDAVCKTVASAGHRRGAQMGVLRVDHPDILDFVWAKQNSNSLTQFNLSVGVTDEFMKAVITGDKFALRFNGREYRKIDARYLWNEIMLGTWDWAEPGTLFIDQINRMNNLWYCEEIAATNPCAEQPLPPFGACLLGSFNLVKYVEFNREYGRHEFRWSRFWADIPYVVRAMDNITDTTLYPLPQQEQEAKSKRRMGIGVTGLANALEACGLPYGSPVFRDATRAILKTLAINCYKASAELAREKGAFPMFDRDKYLAGNFVRKLPEAVQSAIYEHGIRNSHLTSIAPTGTISLTADNVSSGIEPVFSHGYDRTIQTFDGPRVERVDDYGVRVFNHYGRTANELSVQEHVQVLVAASEWVDSAVSKTCNVGDSVTFDEFKDVYLTAWKGGAKGCTTFRASGKRMGILQEVKEESNACYIDPETGNKSCDQ